LRLSRNRIDDIPGRARVCLLADLVVAVVLLIEASLVRGEDGRPPAAADTSMTPVPQTVYTVPPIIVRASRITRTDYDVFMRPGFVAVLDLGERRSRVEDLASVLSQMVGVQVRQYGGLGSFATVSIRGSSSNQVDLYLDGMPLGDSYTGVANLGDLPLDGIQGIEVYRGVSPPNLGSTAIGGVINLRTDTRNPSSGTVPAAGAVPAADTPALAPRNTLAEARASYGSFDTSRYVVSIWPSIGPVKAFLHGKYFQTRGDFTFLDDKGTPDNPADDTEAHRINNDSETINVLARVETRVPIAGKVSLGHNTVLSENGVPGIGSNQSATARSERAAHMTYLELDPDSWLGKRLDVSAKAHYSTTGEQFHDPNGEIGLARQDTDNGFTTYGGDLKTTFNLRPLTFELFWEGKDERFRPRSKIPTPTEGPDRTREAYTTVLSTDFAFDRFGLVLSYTERFHSYTSEFYDPPRFPWLPPQPQGRVSGDRETSQYGFRWLATSFLTVKGNWGEYYRLPTFLELFGNAGSITGSSDLEPEKGLNRDIGAVFSFDRMGPFGSVFFEAVYLDNKVEDLILFFPNSQFTSRPENIGAARIKGCEISFSSLVSTRLRVAGNYTFLDGKDTGPIPYYNGNELPGRPKHDLAVFFDFMHRVGNLSYEYHRIGPNYLDPANQMRVPARDIHNLALRWNTFQKGVALTLEGRNLTDNRVSDVNGFPLPGRSYFVTVSYQHQGG
jgi:outer membrane cobalamin receptor